jgi:hypothetical protein
MKLDVIELSILAAYHRKLGNFERVKELNLDTVLIELTEEEKKLLKKRKRLIRELRKGLKLTFKQGL